MLRNRRYGTSILAAAGLATAVSLGAVAAPSAQAACTTYPQYTVTADSLSVKTQPDGRGDVRGTMHRGDHFNFRSSDGGHVWYYGYAENVGYGFVLAAYLTPTGSYTHCY